VPKLGVSLEHGRLHSVGSSCDIDERTKIRVYPWKKDKKLCLLKNYVSNSKLYATCDKYAHQQ